MSHMKILLDPLNHSLMEVANALVESGADNLMMSFGGDEDDEAGFIMVVPKGETAKAVREFLRKRSDPEDDEHDIIRMSWRDKHLGARCTNIDDLEVTAGEMVGLLKDSIEQDTKQAVRESVAMLEKNLEEESKR